MNKIRIGLIREGKVPPDKRVPLTPKQCARLEKLYPNLEIVVQPSPVRAYKEQDYIDQGIKISEDLSGCDYILGVKEVKVNDLIPNKTFLFFSHTIKKQPYNRDLLKAIVERKIRLIDYEVLKDKSGKRIIGFGRYAGIVGCYNGIRTLGLKKNAYELKPAHTCRDRREMEGQLDLVEFPQDTRIVLTGYGRVGHGAREIMDRLPITEVSPEEFLNQKFDYPVYTHLEAEDYYGRKDGGTFDKREFYSNPELYKSTFSRYLGLTDLYIPCHFWNNKSDFIITKDDLKSKNCRLSVVADISCDINGPIVCTIRSSTIADPIYGYNPETGQEDDFRKDGVIAVMAVDNLPCELPLDASEDFGNELIKEVMPYLIKGDVDGVLERATETTFDGKLTEHFTYLEDYLAGKE